MGYIHAVSTTSKSPAAGPSPDEPLRVGDHAALDFLNSVFTPEDQPVDLLRDGPSLLKWLATSGVVHPTVAGDAAAYSPQQLNRVATEARELREWFRELLFRWSVAGARGVRAADLERLNSMLAKGRLQQTLVRGTDGRFRAILSEYDRSIGYNEPWLGKVHQHYKESQTLAVAKSKGYIFRGKEVIQTPNGPQIRLQFVAR